MNASKKEMTIGERTLVRRCALLMAGSLFFFILAAVTARGVDYYGNGYQSSGGGDPWYSPDDDEDSIMSADDHILASRLRRRVVGNQSVYHIRKASRVHDSVTIVIDENTESELSSSNDLKRDASNNMTLTNWLTPKLSGGLGTKQHGQAAGGNTPTVSWSSGRAHKSDSTIERSQTLSTTLTGEVIQVQPNGYLIVEARKRVNVNGEEQTVTLTGIVNPKHMDSTSSVRAEYIMDMAINYTGKGPLTRMDKRGWGAKIMDFVNPF